MRRLKMSWRSEGRQLICRWLDSEETEKGTISTQLAGVDPAKEDGGPSVGVAVVGRVTGFGRSRERIAK
jgi:hypothetical protein